MPTWNVGTRLGNLRTCPTGGDCLIQQFQSLCVCWCLCMCVCYQQQTAFHTIATPSSSSFSSSPSSCTSLTEGRGGRDGSQICSSSSSDGVEVEVRTCLEPELGGAIDQKVCVRLRQGRSVGLCFLMIWQGGVCLFVSPPLSLMWVLSQI